MKKLILIALSENLMKGSEKVFSYLLPILLFGFGIRIMFGLVNVSHWPSAAFLFFVSLLFCFGAIFMFIKRKSIWK